MRFSTTGYESIYLSSLGASIACELRQESGCFVTASYHLFLKIGPGRLGIGLALTGGELLGLVYTLRDPQPWLAAHLSGFSCLWLD